MDILKLFGNIRFYILLLNFFISIYLFLFFRNQAGFQYNLLQIYALLGAFYLYLALLIGPLAYNFKTRYNSAIIKARRAIGVSAFYFALIHAYLGLFWELGGIGGLFSLDIKFQIAILLSSTALVILSFMAATSFDFMIKFMTFKKWKLLHRFVYAGAIFLLIHALIMGSHFQNFANPIAWTAGALIVFLLFLEGKRTLANLGNLHKTDNPQ